MLKKIALTSFIIGHYCYASSTPGASYFAPDASHPHSHTRAETFVPNAPNSRLNPNALSFVPLTSTPSVTPLIPPAPPIQEIFTQLEQNITHSIGNRSELMKSFSEISQHPDKKHTVEVIRELERIHAHYIRETSEVEKNIHLAGVGKLVHSLIYYIDDALKKDVSAESTSPGIPSEQLSHLKKALFDASILYFKCHTSGSCKHINSHFKIIKFALNYFELCTLIDAINSLIDSPSFKPDCSSARHFIAALTFLGDEHPAQKELLNILAMRIGIKLISSHPKKETSRLKGNYCTLIDKLGSEFTHDKFLEYYMKDTTNISSQIALIFSLISEEAYEEIKNIKETRDYLIRLSELANQLKQEGKLPDEFDPSTFHTYVREQCVDEDSSASA